MYVPWAGVTTHAPLPMLRYGVIQHDWSIWWSWYWDCKAGFTRHYCMSVWHLPQVCDLPLKSIVGCHVCLAFASSLWSPIEIHRGMSCLFGIWLKSAILLVAGTLLCRHHFLVMWMIFHCDHVTSAVYVLTIPLRHCNFPFLSSLSGFTTSQQAWSSTGSDGMWNVGSHCVCTAAVTLDVTFSQV